MGNMGLEERNSLVDALNIVKKECEKHAACETCPMAYRNVVGEMRCYIRDNIPSLWKIKEKERESTWRAFKRLI